jgi:hypothetical protein
MDYKFLDKVIDQIVRETEIDYGGCYVYVTLINKENNWLLTPNKSYDRYFYPHFSHHCKEVYGLNYDETEYVWKEYRDIIKDEIENNGL